MQNTGSQLEFARKPLILLAIQDLLLKGSCFVQIRGCGSSLLTLEPPLPDEQRRSDGAAEGMKRRRGVAEVGKIRSISWRRAKEI